MKLTNKFTLWYLSITLLVMAGGGILAYYKVKRGMDQAGIVRLQNLNNKIAEQIRLGNFSATNTTGRPVVISTLNGPLPEEPVEITENSFYNPDIKHKECRLTVTSFYSINGVNYSIASYNYVTKAKEILTGLRDSFIWIFLLLVVLIAISARQMSRLILAPFKKTLQVVESFDLRRKEKLQLPDTRTKEFRELNCFLCKMTDKAVDDYRSLKEFTENASHELQTPLAIIRTKLELMAESDIREDQARLIGDMQNAVEKLAMINRSLVLLARLENQEYTATKDLDICRITSECLDTFSDLISVRSLGVQTQLEQNVLLRMHPTLADILLNNLIGNAIRHNIADGKISVALMQEQLVIKNTGPEPEVPTEELFGRFKKGSPSSESIGIGLAIVKQICDLSNIKIRYDYSTGWHTVSLDLRQAAWSPNILQSDVFAAQRDTQVQEPA